MKIFIQNGKVYGLQICKKVCNFAPQRLVWVSFRGWGVVVQTDKNTFDNSLFGKPERMLLKAFIDACFDSLKSGRFHSFKARMQ